MGEGCSRVCHITNYASGGRGVAEFVTLQTLLVGGRGVAEFVTLQTLLEGCSRVCHIKNSFSGGGMSNLVYELTAVVLIPINSSLNPIFNSPLYKMLLEVLRKVGKMVTTTPQRDVAALIYENKLNRLVKRDPMRRCQEWLLRHCRPLHC